MYVSMLLVYNKTGFIAIRNFTKRKPTEVGCAGYANPATRYLVSDLKRFPTIFWKPFIIFPIGYQPLLRQHLDVLRWRLVLGLLERQLPQQLVGVLLV